MTVPPQMWARVRTAAGRARPLEYRGMQAPVRVRRRPEEVASPSDHPRHCILTAPAVYYQEARLDTWVTELSS